MNEKEEFIKRLPKQNNYHVEKRIIDDQLVAVLHYKMTDYLFEKHMTYCMENKIVPKVKEQWIEVLIDYNDITYFI